VYRKGGGGVTSKGGWGGGRVEKGGWEEVVLFFSHCSIIVKKGI